MPLNAGGCGTRSTQWLLQMIHEGFKDWNHPQKNQLLVQGGPKKQL